MDIIISLKRNFSDPEKPFFQNYQGRPLGDIKRTKGSIIEEYGLVTGVNFPTATAVRRTVDHHVQTNSKMTLRSSQIAQHSQDVGSKHYHPSKDELRASAMHFINKAEGVEIKKSEPVSEEVIIKRAKLNAGDKATAMANAQEVLRKSAKGRNIKLGGRCKLLPDDRAYLQNVFSKGGEHGGVFEKNQQFIGEFPDVSNATCLFIDFNYTGEKAFSKKFYRVLDSLGEESGCRQRLLSIEETTFGVVKADVEKKLGDWVGTLAQNKMADSCTASALFNSLKTYERNRKGHDESFFNFK